MPPVTLAQLKAAGIAGAQARGLFLRWAIGHHAVENAIFEFAVEQYRANPSAAKLYVLQNFIVNGQGLIAAVNVQAHTLNAVNNFVAAHPPGAGGGWVPGVNAHIFDAAQQDLEQAVYQGWLMNYDDNYNINAPALVGHINNYTADLQAVALALRNAGFDTADMGFVPPYN
ncbi:MAG: hypothetical protein H3C34_09430 [Caldilineaceae bacterium]|nr:hypothetical protein [Caldilineaceae bacterium]